MANNFTVTRIEKETKSEKTIIIDIKRSDDNRNTISGDIDMVVQKLKKITEKE